MTIARIEDVAAGFLDVAKDIGAMQPNVRKITTDAGRAPLPTDNEAEGYAVGSRWLHSGAEWLRTVRGWQPVGGVSVRHFGAVLDGTTDDLPAFNAANASGLSPITVDGPAYISTGISNPKATFLLENNATVTQGAGQFYPREWRALGSGGDSRRLVNFATDDPSPATQPAGTRYPIIESGAALQLRTVNQWGNGDLAANSWRTGIDALFIQSQQSGKGDYYLIRTNGTVYRHADHASVTSIHGHNNIGMFNGQLNAGGAQTTLYGLGDVVLHDQGHANVAMRGQVIIMYANGSDTHGYDVDRFGYMLWSNGTNEVDGAFIARGKLRTPIDTTGAIASEGAMKVAAGQAIYFNASGAGMSNGYVADVPGDYWLVKPTAGNYLEAAAAGARLRLFSGYSGFTPATANAAATRVYGGPGSTSYFGAGQVGNVSYIGAYSEGTDSTSLSLRTAQAGAAADALVISANGVVNIAKAGASLHVAGTKVVGARQAAIPDATAGTEATTINAILATMRAHGLIAP